MEAALTEILSEGPLEIRPSQHVAILTGRTLNLTRHELGLLIALARRAGAVIGREELAEQAWGRPLGSGDRSVDVYVRRLRQKLAEAEPDGSSSTRISRSDTASELSVHNFFTFKAQVSNRVPAVLSEPAGQ